MSTRTFEVDLYTHLNIDPGAPASAIRSAYRTLAHRLHPDRNAAPDAHREMVRINKAYQTLRDPALRQAYDATRSAPPPVAPPKPAPTRFDAAGRLILTFGRYQGWALTEVMRQEPEYLEWLSRHSSGIGYRREIQRLFDERRARR
ncbi:MAG: DnaJ domain-containing protein [Chloroflexi bacterium]|nr:DnaJ domain-containing protein [Chloroflexota bacterium]